MQIEKVPYALKECGWGEGRQGRRAEPKMLSLGREGKGSGLALLRVRGTGSWKAEEGRQKGLVTLASGAAKT